MMRPRMPAGSMGPQIWAARGGGVGCVSTREHIPRGCACCGVRHSLRERESVCVCVCVSVMCVSVSVCECECVCGRTGSSRLHWMVGEDLRKYALEAPVGSLSQPKNSRAYDAKKA